MCKFNVTGSLEVKDEVLEIMIADTLGVPQEPVLPPKRLIRRKETRKKHKRALKTLDMSYCTWRAMCAKSKDPYCFEFLTETLAMYDNGRVYVVKGGHVHAGNEYKFLKRAFARKVRRAPDDEVISSHDGHFKRITGTVSYVYF